MIDTFPQFSRFNLNDAHLYSKYLRNFAPYGDFSLVNLEIWLNIVDDLEVSDLNGNLILRFTNVFSDNRSRSYSFIGLIDVDKSLSDLSRYLRQNNENTTLYSTPEETRALITKFKCQDDRDSYDYVYSTEEQVRLLGTKFGKYRRRVNGFITSNLDSIVINEFDLSKPDNFNHVVNSLHTWKRTYELGGNDVERWESRAISKSFKYCNELKLRCIAIIIDSKIEAFTLFSINEDHSIADIHHTKCSYEHRNIFDFTLFATASKLRTERIQSMNLEQDLGIEGLREHKLGLRPANFLKKFTVFLA